jgi:hypothetical protein
LLLTTINVKITTANSLLRTLVERSCRTATIMVIFATVNHDEERYYIKARD